MRSVQKIVRNGNSAQITITKPVLVWLGWLPGDAVVIEVLEDKTLHVAPFDAHARNVKSMRPVLQTPLTDVTR